MVRQTVLLSVALVAAHVGSQVSVLPGTPPAAATQAAPGTAMITGRILSDADVPIPAAVVSISRGPRSEATNVLTDTDGRFFFDRLVTGSYSLTASRRGWLPGAYGRE